MAQPYVGEIRMFAGNFAPAGWMFCDGQLLPISENETLFQLIGTTYGGDGEETFALPDLRGRVPIHQGNGFILARDGRRRGGDADRPARSPPTRHPCSRDRPASRPTSPAAQCCAAQPRRPTSTSRPGDRRRCAPASIAPAGGSQPHTNFQPYLCVNFIISLFGIFPRPT